MPRLADLPRRVLVSPSILAADFARMHEACATVLSPASGAAADLLHLDVMDGHFVPNLTMGPDMCRALRQAFPDTPLDVHLMVTDPEPFLEPFAKAGANLLTYHIEATAPQSPSGDLSRARAVAKRIRELGCDAAIALNPATPVEAVEPLLVGTGGVGEVDMVLVMSVVPGYAGQSFMPEVLEKVRRVRAVAPDVRIQMDGGVTPENARACRDSGADVLVAAKAIFGQSDHERGNIIGNLRGDSRPS